MNNKYASVKSYLLNLIVGTQNIKGKKKISTGLKAKKQTLTNTHKPKQANKKPQTNEKVTEENVLKFQK